MNRKEKIDLEVEKIIELGKKKGELKAKIENGKLNGTLSLLGHTEPIEGSVDEKGNGYYVVVNHGYTTIDGGIFTSPGGMSSLIENGYYNYNSNLASTGYVEGQNVQSPKLTINNGLFINDYNFY